MFQLLFFCCPWPYFLNVLCSWMDFWWTAHPMEKKNGPFCNPFHSPSTNNNHSLIIFHYFANCQFVILPRPNRKWQVNEWGARANALACCSRQHSKIPGRDPVLLLAAVLDGRSFLHRPMGCLTYNFVSLIFLNTTTTFTTHKTLLPQFLFPLPSSA